MSLRKREKQYNYTDIAAVLLGAALLVLFAYAARLGFPDADETNYCNMRQCFLEGDRVFIDEWDFCQMAFLLDLPVYWAYTHFAGGTEGVILFMRYWFVALDVLFYCYMYRKLRTFGWAGLAASFFFCALVPETINALGYFTVALMAFTAACLILITDKTKKGRLRTFLAGVLFAFAVMSEPFLIFVFAFYVLAVAVNALLKRLKRFAFSEKYAFIFGGRTFLWLSLGAFAVFVAFMALLAWMGTLRMLPELLPYLLKSTGYNAEKVFRTTKLMQVVRYFGKGPVVTLLLCLAAAAVLRFLPARFRAARFAVFAVSCAVPVFTYIPLVIGTFVAMKREMLYFIYYLTAPVLVCSVIWSLLDPKKDGRLLALCGAAVLYSAAVDFPSHALIGSGGSIAFIAGCITFSRLASELVHALRDSGARTDQPPRIRRLRRAGPAAALCTAALYLVSLGVWNCTYVFLITLHKPIEVYFSGSFAANADPFSQEITRGPNKGLITSDHIARIYYDTLDDLDGINREAAGSPVMVMGDVPYTYLYLDLPHANFGAWNKNETDRMLDYWTLFPERTPGYVYLPYYDVLFYRISPEMYSTGRYEMVQQFTEIFDELGEFDVRYGKAGVIIKVLDG